jgi:hypothetical protein
MKSEPNTTHEQASSIIRIWHNLDSDTMDNDGVDMTIEFEILETGTLYSQSWTPETIQTIHPLFVADAELAIDMTTEEPVDISYNNVRASCTFSIKLGSRKTTVTFILPRVVVEGEPGLTKRVAILEEAYLKSASLPLGLISQVNEMMLPKTYMRISEFFPHLTLAEIFLFEKKVIENGGSIRVHSGWFATTERCPYTNTGVYLQYYTSWTCCHHLVNDNSGRIYGYAPLNIIGANGPTIIGSGASCCRYYFKLQPDITSTGIDKRDKPRVCGVAHKKTSIICKGSITCVTCGAIGLRDRNPTNFCDNQATFYLYEQDEKTIDIAEQKVKSASECIQRNICNYQETIEKLTLEIEKLSKTNNALMMLDIT